MIDETSGLPYYYHTKTAETVWERPQAFVIPLNILQVRPFSLHLLFERRCFVAVVLPTPTFPESKTLSRSRNSQQGTIQIGNNLECSLAASLSSTTRRTAHRFNVNSRVWPLTIHKSHPSLHDHSLYAYRTLPSLADCPSTGIRSSNRVTRLPTTNQGTEDPVHTPTLETQISPVRNPRLPNDGLTHPLGVLLGGIRVSRHRQGLGTHQSLHESHLRMEGINWGLRSLLIIPVRSRTNAAILCFPSLVRRMLQIPVPRPLLPAKKRRRLQTALADRRPIGQRNR